MSRIDAREGTTKVRAVPEKDTKQREDETTTPKEKSEAAAPEEPKKASARRGEDGDDPEAAEGSGTDNSDAAARVAEALGVGGSDDEVEAGAGADEAVPAKETAAAPNRAARRRDEAQRRRKKRSGGAGEDKEELPRDRNARAKELLLRRQEQATEGGRRPIDLLPGEMVDDALARTWSATGKWLRANFNVLQWVILAGLVGLGGFLFYTTRVEKKAGGASEALVSGIAAQRGRVMEEDKRSEEEKEYDLGRVFKTSDERSDTALAGYNKVIDQYPGTGAAMLAKLGQAGVLLDKRDYAHALDAYNVVLSSPLANADLDVKGRALEGAGYAKEGKGDIDGALETFKELGKIDAKGYKELSKYHQARLLLAKGEKEKAKDLLKEVLALKSGDKDPTKDILSNPADKGTLPGVDSQTFPFLKTMSEELLRSIDPSAVPARTRLGGPAGSQMTPEELQELIKRAREKAEQKGADQHGEP